MSEEGARVGVFENITTVTTVHRPPEGVPENYDGCHRCGNTLNEKLRCTSCGMRHAFVAFSPTILIADGGPAVQGARLSIHPSGLWTEDGKTMSKGKWALTGYLLGLADSKRLKKQLGDDIMLKLARLLARMK